MHKLVANPSPFGVFGFSFLKEFTSDRAWGDDGYLSDRGLIPMPFGERRETAAAVSSLTPSALAKE
jgi:phosphate transport system substrate-binding protein